LLTSNRVESFDDAFKSRISVPLKYNDLNTASRKQIWKHFLRDEGIDDATLDVLAQADINGRQIKNVIRTAKSLAQFHGEKVDQEKLEQVVKIQVEFEAGMDLGKGGHVGGIQRLRTASMVTECARERKRLCSFARLVHQTIHSLYSLV
jgi:SpoVK/Ycf46/Vps4 family AAA+-type ATPase